VKDDVQHDHEKVQELRNLSRWSDGHFWVSPEQHGNLVSDVQHMNECSVLIKMRRQLSSRTRSIGSLSALDL